MKEQGATVYGFGKKQTPAAFRNACSRFIYVENLHDETEEIGNVVGKKESSQLQISKTAKTSITKGKGLPLETLHKIFEQQPDWIQLGLLGQQ